jgi:hypothetical protein
MNDTDGWVMSKKNPLKFNLKWIKCIYKKDMKKLLKNMSLYSLSNIWDYKYIIFFIIIYGFKNHTNEDNIIVVHFMLDFIVYLISYISTLFIVSFLNTYLINSLTWPKWNYGVNSNGEKHLLIENENETRIGTITKWLGETEYPEPEDNIVKFIGLDLQEYDIAKNREDIINEVIN